MPVRTEQVIYSLIAYNGKDYSPTFAPETSATISLLANADTFVSVRTTLVYWWPPSGKWQTDTAALNEFQPGSLEVRSRGHAPRLIPMSRYSVFKVSGEYQQSWRVALGTEAEQQYQRARDIAEGYAKAAASYQKDREAYLARLRALSTRIEALRSQGRDASALQDEMESVQSPEPPRPPDQYVVPPTPVQSAFVVNLPPGRYSVRLLDREGAALEGSERVVVAHERRRGGLVGYEVFPGDKWTQPSESKTPTSILYVNGKADLYLTAFYQEEYNELEYARTVDNAARGNPGIYSWVRIEQVPHATLSLDGLASGSTVLEERPFIVKQDEGTGVGYTILPLGSREADQGEQASLIAFRVPIVEAGRTFRLHTVDAEGNALKGSGREVRVIEPARNRFLLALFALLPILALALALALRARPH